MNGKDEKTGIEALGSPNSRKMPPGTKRGRKNRGLPPPATFDIDTLPGSSNLTALEAAVIRRTPGALEQWRRAPNRPLKWRYVDGRPLYRVDAVREYLAGCDQSTKRPRADQLRDVVVSSFERHLADDPLFFVIVDLIDSAELLSDTQPLDFIVVAAARHGGAQAAP